jgi:hypothetical protein
MAAGQRNRDVHSFALFRARHHNEAALTGSRSTSRERRQAVAIDSAKHGVRTVRQSTALAVAKAIDKSFDPATSIRALQFYGDGTLDRVPLAMQQDLARWALQVDLNKLPELRPRHGLSPGGMEL